MVLLIDTSSACSAVAVVDEEGRARGEIVRAGGRDFDLRGAVRELVSAPQELTRIGIAVGPGSFTGLRIGIAFAVGLAMSRQLPVHPLSTLQLAAARARVPATGVSEAGRGRLYYLDAAGIPRLGGPGDLPPGRPVAGWLQNATCDAVRKAGLQILETDELKPFAEAAWTLMQRSAELPYGRVKAEYMHTFGGLV